MQLVSITSIPIAINIFLTGTFPTNRAAIGAANNPPNINPAISTNGRLLRKIKNVIELQSTTKNSARQTEPIT